MGVDGEPRGGRWVRLGDGLRERLWFWPALLGILAAVAAEALVRADRALEAGGSRPPWVFSGNADAARAVLGAIATATMTVLGVTLSITLAVLVLTAQGYSPRALRRFMRDRVIQAVIAGFLATFVFALVALRLVREDQVPGITVNVAVVLGFVVLGLLVVFFHHMASEIRVERLIEAIWQETRDTIPRTLPESHAGSGPPTEPGEPLVASAPAAGTGRIRWIDDAALAEVARESGGTAVVRPAPGDFVAEGEPVIRMLGGDPLAPAQRERLTAAVMLGTQRSMSQDVAFGLRQLTDVALRALSPGINDPTTAHEAILRQADLLRRMADRRLGSSVVDDDGRPLVLRDRPSWDDLVGLAFDQCAREAESRADAATMLVLLDALARVFVATDAPDRLPSLRRRARRIRDGAHRCLPDPDDLAAVEHAAAPLA